MTWRAMSVKLNKHKIMTMGLAVMLMASTLISSVSPFVQPVSAVSIEDRVVINEVAPTAGTDEKWVELYNPTAEAVDISDWRLQRNNTGNISPVFGDDLSIPSGGYYVYTTTSSFSPNAANLKLLNGVGGVTVDEVDYPQLINGQSYARTFDGSSKLEIRDSAENTRGATNGSAPVVQAELNVENFNTVDSNYKGISVGFNAKDFGTVTAVSVKLERTDGTSVTKTANQGVLDIISNQTNTQQLTAPFVVEEGTFTEASDVQYWNPAPTTWTTGTVPERVIITIVDEKGEKTAESTAFSEGAPSWPSYESLIPPAPPVVTYESVNANTVDESAGENGSNGWWFDRDQTTSTDFSFVGNTPSIGEGSLYVPPIGSNPKDKFIAEYFYLDSADKFESFSYDFNIAGGANTDKNQFYLNVYTSLSDKPVKNFYDCRYNFVAVSGSVGSYTTSTVTRDTVATNVTPRGAATCPASKTISGLEPGSSIRAIAINVGDTNVNDVGLQGYLDNAVLSTSETITTYDFEAAPVDPGNKNALNLSGTVFRDNKLNDCNNRTQCLDQSGDVLAGWEMRLYKENDGVWQFVRSATTNEDGVYNFGAQQSAGVYHTCEVLKSGWEQPVQLWTGSGYRVATENVSGEGDEGPFCATTTYSDEADRSSKSRFGNVDVARPTIEVVDPNVNSYHNDELIVRIKATDAESGVGQVVANLKDSTGAQLAGCINENGIGAEAYTATCTIDTTEYDDGDYTIRTNARDRSGNISQTLNHSVVFDNESPVIKTPVEFTEGGAAENANVNGEVSFLVEQTEANPGKLYIEYMQLEYNADKDEMQWEKKQGKEFLNSGAATFTVDTGKWDEGRHQIKISSTDKAGNKDGHSFFVNVDRSAPLLVVNQPSSPASFAEDETFTVSGTATDSSGVDRVVLLINRDGSRVERVVIRDLGQNGEFSYTFPVNTFANGSYRLNVNAFDTNQGNGATNYRQDVTVTEPAEEPEGDVLGDRDDEASQPGRGSGSGVTNNGPLQNSSPLANVGALTNIAANDDGQASNSNGLPQTQSDDSNEAQQSRVLAQEDENTDSQSAVSDDENSEEGCYTIFDICWYWVAAAGVALIALISYVVARRRADESL